MRQRNKNGIQSLLISLLLLLSFSASAQSRQEKTISIIEKMNFIENQKANYKFQLETVKFQATGNDSLKIIELEKILSDEEMAKRLVNAFDEIFRDTEIDDIYRFIYSSAFDKLSKAKKTYETISNHFNDIDNEIKRISENINKTIDTPVDKFIPIPVNKENGFYETIDYTPSANENNIKLVDKPSLTFNDILEVKKTCINKDIQQYEIDIILKTEGARKFYKLTKDNIGKPIAIVIEKQIVTMPIVRSEIIGGKVSISGVYSETEIDKMIEKLKGK